MATLRNKRKLAAVSRETPDSSRGSRGWNVLDPELTQDYISQVSEEIEGRETKKLSKEFNKTESRILGALSKLDEFLPNPQARTCSVVQGASRIANSESRETHGDRSSVDPYPEGGYFPHHSAQLNSSEADMLTETYPHMVTGATRENRHYPHMVTGATEEICHNPHATTPTQEEIPYCSPPLLLRQANRRRRALQVNLNFAVRIPPRQAAQILWALKQLATNYNSANIDNNNSRISELPKSLTTTMSTFDGKSEKFELFEDLFRTSLKIHNQLTEEDKISYFHSLMRGDALQTFKNITSPNRENLG